MVCSGSLLALVQTFPTLFLPLRTSWPKTLSSWRWNCVTFYNTSTLRKPSDCFTHALGIERWPTLLSTAMPPLHPLGNTPSLGIPFISPLVIPETSFTGSQWERVKRLRALPRQNFTPWLLPENLLATFRLLVHESFTSSMVMSLRCDNTAAIAMLEEPGWRTRYISIYGEAIRQEMLSNALALAHVSSEFQLADPLTKPTSSSINSIIFPQWGLVRFTPSCWQHLFTPLTPSGLRGSLRLPVLLAFSSWHSLAQLICLIHLLLLSGSTSLYLLLSRCISSRGMLASVPQSAYAVCLSLC